MPRSISALALSVVVFLGILVGASDGQILASHQGQFDPMTEGFGYTDSFGPAATGPVTDDLGLGISAWDIASQSAHAQAGYEVHFNATQNAAIAARGDMMTLDARVVSGPLNSPTANFYPSGGAAFDFGTARRYDIQLGLNSNGDTVVVLPSDLLGGSNYYTPGMSYTLAGSGSSYHLYQLVYDPTTQSASLFVDGIDRLNRYTGQTDFYDGGGTGFATVNDGQLNVTSFEFQTPDIPGDLNHDGTVNAQDISLLASNWLQKGSTVSGDANNDGIVNGQDIAVIAGHWLWTIQGAPGATTAVPEPSSIALLAVGVFGIAIAARSKMRAACNLSA
jgi:PEP-CTERM motif/Dockerin type I domain